MQRDRDDGTQAGERAGTQVSRKVVFIAKHLAPWQNTATSWAAFSSSTVKCERAVIVDPHTNKQHTWEPPKLTGFPTRRAHALRLSSLDTVNTVDTVDTVDPPTAGASPRTF